VRSVELGLDATLPTRTRAAVSLFAQRLTDMIYRQRVSPVLNVVTNAGEAKVEGVEVEVAQPLLDGRLRLLATATHLFRYDITRNDAVPASVGKRLTDVPQSLYSLSLEGAADRWSGSLVWRYASHFGLATTRTGVVQNVFGSYDRYGVASLKIGREVSTGLTASVAVDNLANTHYFQFYRQPGRSVWFELAWRRE
jgi:iron complex outermembrane receptor protein